MGGYFLYSIKKLKEKKPKLLSVSICEQLGEYIRFPNTIKTYHAGLKYTRPDVLEQYLYLNIDRLCPTEIKLNHSYRQLKSYFGTASSSVSPAKYYTWNQYSQKRFSLPCITQIYTFHIQSFVQTFEEVLFTYSRINSY